MIVSRSKTEQNPNPWLVHRQPCPCPLSMDPFKLFGPHPIFSLHDMMPARRKLCDQLLDTINVFFQSSNRDDGLANTCGRINPAQHQKDGPVDPPTSQPWLHPWRSWDLYWIEWQVSVKYSNQLRAFIWAHLFLHATTKRSENAEIRALISLGDLGIHDCQLFLLRISLWSISLWSWISTCRHPVSCICLLQLCCTHCFNFCVIKLISMMTNLDLLLVARCRRHTTHSHWCGRWRRPEQVDVRHVEQAKCNPPHQRRLDHLHRWKPTISCSLTVRVHQCDPHGAESSLNHIWRAQSQHSHWRSSAKCHGEMLPHRCLNTCPLPDIIEWCQWRQLSWSWQQWERHPNARKEDAETTVTETMGSETIFVSQEPALGCRYPKRSRALAPPQITPTIKVTSSKANNMTNQWDPCYVQSFRQNGIGGYHTDKHPNG